MNNLDVENKIFNIEDKSTLTRRLNLKYATWLNDRYFDLEILTEQDAVYVDVTLLNSSKTFFYPINSRMELKHQNLDTFNAINFLFSFIESYFDEFFEQEEEVTLPIDWKGYTCEGIDFQVRGQIQNKYVEDLADRLLAGESVSEEEIKGLRLKL